MKARILFSILLSASVALFASCDNDDDSRNFTVPQDVETTFRAMYPTATMVNWEIEGSYYEVDFVFENREREAWFSMQGIWSMTRTDLPGVASVPDLVRQAFEASEWASWRVDDVDMIERANMDTLYVIEVESGNAEVYITYSESGDLVKNANTPDNINDTPNTDVKSLFASMYPNATQVEWENKITYYEVEFYNERFECEAWFSLTPEWMLTKTELRVLSDLPEPVRTSFGVSEWANWQIEDIDRYEEPAVTYYMIEVESGQKEVYLKYSSTGELLVVTENGNGTGGENNTGLSQTIQDFIAQRYPNSTIIEYDINYNKIEVEIRQYTNNAYVEREVVFDTGGNWLYTETEDILQSDVPQNVMNVLKASEYGSYYIDDIDYIESESENYYLFELEGTSKEVELKITIEGVLTVIKVENDR